MAHGKNENFDGAGFAEPPDYLFGRIMGCIGLEKKLAASRRKAAYFSLALVGSAAAFLAAFIALAGALAQSDVFRILSLIGSDPGTVSANLQDFALFFLESLPSLYVVLFLASLFALLESLKYISKWGNEVFSLSRSEPAASGG